jgi:glycosyltransferase involved in cell wall biosynthesis
VFLKTKKPMAQLSIIIPVYRVEQTLDRCVRSVLCCERRDIEVLLVDDGSPDCCGTLCDHWATRDARVRVLHKRNGGLSDARNAGIEASHGDLLMFVDSDDELAPGTIEAAMKTMEEDEACDIAEFGVLRVSRSSDDKEERACSKPVDGSCSNKPLFLEGELVFDPQTVSETHYADMRLYWLRTRAYTHSYAWNKIYRRWLFQDVRYPVGRVFEDMFTLPQLLLLATKAARYANDAKPAAHGLQTLHTQKPQTLHLPWSRNVLDLMPTGGARLRKLAQLEVLTQLLLEVHIYSLVLSLLYHSLVLSHLSYSFFLYLFYNLVSSFFVHRVFHNCFF